MAAEVSPGGLGDVDLVGDDAVIDRGFDALPVSVNVPEGLPHVTLDIEGEPRGLGNSETEVESDTSGNATETDEETPTVVNGRGFGGRPVQNGILVSCDNDEGDEGGGCWNLRSMSWQFWLDIEFTHRSYRSLGRRRWQSSYGHESEWKQTRKR